MTRFTMLGTQSHPERAYAGLGVILGLAVGLVCHV